LVDVDINFINGLRSSNEEVYEHLFRSYYERLCRYANTIVKDEDESEEIVQSTFLVLWEKRLEVDIHTSMKSYLYKMVHNTCLNKVKHNKVKQTHSEYYLQQAEIMGESASSELMSKELQNEIDIAINLMPTQCRTVFELSKVENLTYAEIADQLNISIKTVEKHKMKALRILREQLKDYLPVLFLLFFSKN